MTWHYPDNVYYESRNGCVYLHTPDEDFFYVYNNPPIGKGGMGKVVQGKSLTTGRLVAIKEVHPCFADIPEIRQRAKNEAGLKFRHENLVEMLGFVERKDHRGPIYIISNFVIGQNIDKFIINFDGFPKLERERRIVDLMTSVLDALDYIHGKGICHLDIKPSNIMIENGRNVRLLDLGISMPHEMQAMLDRQRRLQPGSAPDFMGTPKYAAPEQFGLTSYGKISSRSDIYGFAVTLYELLAGFNPFSSAMKITDAMEMHKSLRLPKAEMISSSVYEVLVKAASPYQTQRYQSAGELAEALYEAIRHKPSILERTIHLFKK